MTETITARNARAEAQAVLPEGFEARVLEPSAPADTDEQFFADDPVAPTGRADGARLVVPTGVAGDLTWDQWLADNPAHAGFVTSRWLGGSRRLPTAPAALPATREALHRLATYVIAPVRHQANGKFGLRYTHGGFGTPFFADDRQIRVEGGHLIDQVGDEVRMTPITSLSSAARFLGTEIDPDTAAEHDSPPVGDVEADLEIDEDASRFLGEWYGMGFAALEAVRADDASVDPSRPQLWPGHFDPAIEIGDEDHRGSYGASPGDHNIAEPYLYVSVWWPDRLGIEVDDPAWNADGFVGANLKLSDFPVDADPVLVAADFWRQARDRLG